jgi:hypothetical protein
VITLGSLLRYQHLCADSEGAPNALRPTRWPGTSAAARTTTQPRPLVSWHSVKFQPPGFPRLSPSPELLGPPTGAEKLSLPRPPSRLPLEIPAKGCATKPLTRLPLIVSRTRTRPRASGVVEGDSVIAWQSTPNLPSVSSDEACARRVQRSPRRSSCLHLSAVARPN